MPISIQEIQLLRTCFDSLQSSFSECCAGNIFLFQAAHQYTIMSIAGVPWVKGTSYASDPFLLPLSNQFHQKAIRDHMGQAKYVYPITDEQYQQFFAPFGWQAISDEGDADYLYSAESLRTFKGRALDGRRNQLHAFQAAYPIRSEPITTNNAHLALAILELWKQQHPNIFPSDDVACRLALTEFERANLKRLDLVGRIIFANDEPVGFVIGEPLNGEVFVLHFAKGARQEKGLYQLLYFDFINALPPQYHYINMEQDLGISALRQSKLMYHPLQKLRKLRITPPWS